MNVAKFFASFFQTIGIGVIVISMASAGSLALADWIPVPDGDQCTIDDVTLKCPGKAHHNCPPARKNCVKKTSGGGGSPYCDCEP